MNFPGLWQTAFETLTYEGVYFTTEPFLYTKFGQFGAQTRIFLRAIIKKPHLAAKTRTCGPGLPKWECILYGHDGCLPGHPWLGVGGHHLVSRVGFLSLAWCSIRVSYLLLLMRNRTWHEVLQAPVLLK